MFQFERRPTYAEMRRLAIRRAADGDHHARDFLLRGFIRKAKQGRDPVAHVVADVLESVLADESVGKILGTQRKRGRPPTYEKAILIHAMVQYVMLQRILRPVRTKRRGDDAQAEVAETLGMSLDTVRDNYKRVSRRLNEIRDEFPYINLERSGFSLTEALYIASYILVGPQICADGRRRYISSTHLATHKNVLDEIIDRFCTEDLAQAPGWLWQSLQSVCESNFWLLEDCVERPVAKAE